MTDKRYREFWTDGIGIVTKDVEYANNFNSEGPSHPLIHVIEYRAVTDLREQLVKEREATSRIIDELKQRLFVYRDFDKERAKP